MKPYTFFILMTIILSSQNMASCTVTGNKDQRSDPRIIPIITKEPEEMKVYPIAIIGAGAGGMMALKRSVLNNIETLLFTGAKEDQRRSRGNWVRTVDNVPGLTKYKRTILELRNEVLEELACSPLSSNLYVIKDSVCSIEKEMNFFKLTDNSGQDYYAKYVILATGIMDEQPHIQGSIRPILKYANSQTVAYCSLCDGHRSFAKNSVVIGHSESAAKNALMLHSKYQLPSMTLLTNGQEPDFNLETSKQLQMKKIVIQTSPIQEVFGNEETKHLSGFKLENGETINAEMAFISLGIRPNNQLALQLNAQVDSKGLVITNSDGESSTPNLFVVGDLRSGSMHQIYTAWQQAVESVRLISNRIFEP